MKTVYILQYSLVDSINRVRHRSLYGVLDSQDKIDNVKKKILKAHPEYSVIFDVFASPHLFA